MWKERISRTTIWYSVGIVVAMLVVTFLALKFYYGW